MFLNFCKDQTWPSVPETKEHGFFINESDKKIKEWDILLNSKLREYNIYNSLQLKNGDFILGSVANGILYINKEKEISFTKILITI